MNLASTDCQKRGWEQGAEFFPDPVEIVVRVLDDNDLERYLEEVVRPSSDAAYLLGIELLSKLLAYPEAKLENVRLICSDDGWVEIRTLSAAFMDHLSLLARTN